MEYEIHRIRPEEFDAVCGSLWDVKGNQAMAEQFRRQALAGTREIFACRLEGRWAAEAALVYQMEDPHYTVPGQRAYLSHFLTAQGLRGRGIGAAMAERLFAHAAGLGLRELSVGVDLDNYHALRFYHRLGFTTLLFVGEDEGGRFLKLLKRL